MLRPYCIVVRKLFITRKNKNRGLRVTCSLRLQNYDLCNSCAYIIIISRISYDSYATICSSLREIYERIKWKNVAHKLYLIIIELNFDCVQLTFRRMHAWPNLAPRVHWNMKRTCLGSKSRLARVKLRSLYYSVDSCA